MCLQKRFNKICSENIATKSQMISLFTLSLTVAVIAITLASCSNKSANNSENSNNSSSSQTSNTVNNTSSSSSESGNSSSNNSSQYQTSAMSTIDNSTIGIEAAKEIALADAGLEASDVSFVKTEIDESASGPVYDIEFIYESVDYEYEIDAKTGKILSSDTD